MVGPKMLTERDKEKMHLDIADEQLDTIGRAVMGLTLGCARCHDHKFDPVSAEDYYAMAGILHSTRTADRVLMNNVNVTGWTNTPLPLDRETEERMADYEQRTALLRRDLNAARQRLEELQQQGGVLVDDPDAEKNGPWRRSTFRPNRIGENYLATDKGKGPYAIVWHADLPRPGRYEVRVTFGGGSGLARAAQYEVTHADGQTRLLVDQTVQPAIGGLWQKIGEFEFGETATLRLTDENADGFVIADAVQFLPAGSESADGAAAMAGLTARVASLEEQLKKLQEEAPEPQMAMAAMDHKQERTGDLQLRIRGEAANRGPLVPRGVLQVASPEGAAALSIPEGESGRLQMAEWLTEPAHPLTARVMANRIWQHLFGRGIVETVDNFGLRGTPPSNPELLDFLAGRFVAHGWSVKMLIRDIVCSEAYQQRAVNESGEALTGTKQIPQIRRVVSAEAMRDSMLFISGTLDPGRRNSVVKQLGMYAIATSGARHSSLAETGGMRQRSIYLPVVRGAIPPSLRVFDFPNPDLVTGARAETTVPAQALFMMNSPFVRSMAAAAGARLHQLDCSEPDMIRELYRMALVREPSEQELAAAITFLKKQSAAGRGPQENLAALAQVVFSSAEFRFVE